MLIWIWRAMNPAGEPPDWGEDVNVFCPEMVETEDVKCVAYWGGGFSFPLTKFSVILHMSNLQSFLFPNCLLTERNSWLKNKKKHRHPCINACFYNPNLQLLYIEVKRSLLQRSQRFPGPAAVWKRAPKVNINGSKDSATSSASSDIEISRQLFRMQLYCSLEKKIGSFFSSLSFLWSG